MLLLFEKKNGNHSSFWIKNQNKYQFDMGMFIAVSKNSSKIFNYLRSITKFLFCQYNGQLKIWKHLKKHFVIVNSEKEIRSIECAKELFGVLIKDRCN